MGYLFSYLSTATVFELTNPLHYDKTQVLLLAERGTPQRA